MNENFIVRIGLTNNPERPYGLKTLDENGTFSKSFKLPNGKTPVFSDVDSLIEFTRKNYLQIYGDIATYQPEMLHLRLQNAPQKLQEGILSVWTEQTEPLGEEKYFTAMKTPSGREYIRPFDTYDEVKHYAIANDVVPNVSSELETQYQAKDASKRTEFESILAKAVPENLTTNYTEKGQIKSYESTFAIQNKADLKELLRGRVSMFDRFATMKEFSKNKEIQLSMALDRNGEQYLKLNLDKKDIVIPLHDKECAIVRHHILDKVNLLYTDVARKPLAMSDMMDISTMQRLNTAKEHQTYVLDNVLKNTPIAEITGLSEEAYSQNRNRNRIRTVMTISDSEAYEKLVMNLPESARKEADNLYQTQGYINIASVVSERNGMQIHIDPSTQPVSANLYQVDLQLRPHEQQTIADKMIAQMNERFDYLLHTHPSVGAGAVPRPITNIMECVQGFRWLKNHDKEARQQILLPASQRSPYWQEEFHYSEQALEAKMMDEFRQQRESRKKSVLER